ncbi:MAG: NAD-dependent epimerase/dehydratase family protein [Polyangiaceae bacterium]|nr:NAD-dependent epimerase/dehydratase family protein [Polyangiaceae bacterium]
MRALVIGGTGFVGLNIVDELLAKGAEVRVSRRAQSITMLVRRRAVSFVEASLEEPEKLRRAMDGCDVVFLAGAPYPRYSIDLSASLEEGTRCVRNACDAAHAASIPRLVYTSTIATLDHVSGRPACEDDVPASMPEGSVYRAMKWAMEREVDDARRRGLDAVTLLPGGCIGPGDLRVGTASVIVGVIRGMLTWWVDGMVNLVDVGDVARAHLAAAAPTPHDRYALAGHTVRVRDLLEKIAQRYGGTLPSLELGAEEARARSLADEIAAAPRRERVSIPRELVDMATTGQVVSNARATADLGFSPTPLDDALDRAHAWLSRFSILPKQETERRTHDHG